MDTCPNCGHRMRKKWNNCPKCNYSLTNLPETNNTRTVKVGTSNVINKCPYCGAVVNNTAKFCGQCGANLFINSQSRDNLGLNTNNFVEYIDEKGNEISEQDYNKNTPELSALGNTENDSKKTSLPKIGCGCFAFILFILALIGSCAKSPEPKPDITPKSAVVSNKAIDVKPKTNNSSNTNKANVVVPPVSQPQVKNTPVVNKRSIQVIGNRNSRIYHRLNCSSVRKMKDSNKVFFNSIEEASGRGYRACQRCG